MRRCAYGFGLFAGVIALSIYACMVPFGVTKLDSEAAHEGYDPLADYRVDCRNDEYQITNSLWMLPFGMRGILSGTEEMSSTGGPFNDSDVGLGPHLRFVEAAVGRSHIIAAVEHGGEGYGVDVWAFKRDDYLHWTGHRLVGVMGDVRMTLPQLIALTCKE